MTRLRYFLPLLSGLILLNLSCSSATKGVSQGVSTLPNETRLSNLRQLTVEGTNAEAYWSFDSDWLTFQHSGIDAPCDQIYSMRSDGSDLRRVSNGQGRTTCSYFFPNNETIIYSSTYKASPTCPPVPDKTNGYVWPIYDSYQIYRTDKEGKDHLPVEPAAPSAYNAEATVCKDKSVVFTSDRHGDLDLYVGKIDSLNSLVEIKRVTKQLGYDGGAFFSPDCKKIVWRASRPQPGKEAEEYRSLLKKHLVRPGQLEIWTANADGSNARQITNLGSASFAPFFTPDSKQILFASNAGDPKKRRFNIYIINTDGTGLEQVTYSDTFDSFPMISPDGKKLAFSSNRNAKKPGDTNVFVADWVSKPISKNFLLEDTLAANRFYALVAELSSPGLEGRGIGTRGLKLAEDLVEDRFKILGLAPFQKGSYRVPIEIQTGVGADPSLTTLRSGDQTLLLGREFNAVAFSSNGKFSGELVDAGYGIVSPELGLNDYEKIAPKGKIVLIRRHVPAKLKLTPAQERSYGDLRYKTFLARGKGAQAVIFWEDDPHASQDVSKILRTTGEALSSEAGIPVLVAKRETVQGWLNTSGKKVTQLNGSVGLERKTARADNIVASWGKGCGKVKPVVIGAHLDHLGMGAHSSLDPTKGGVIHPGADDNASGVAALVEAARIIKAGTQEGCYLFAAFTAEESGVAGSSKFVEKLKELKITPKAMLNMDMVGRLENNTLMAFGADSASEWPKILETECQKRRLNCLGSGDGYGPSDHMPFYIAGTPVLHFFTGPHGDYHRSTDVVDHINATGGVQVAEVVAAVALNVGQSKQRLSFQKPKPGTSVMGRIGREGDRKSYGAYLGTIPDYAQMASAGGPSQDTSLRGVKLAGVRTGSPAEQAGLKAGDILKAITEFDDQGKAKRHEIQSLEDFMFVLTSLKPGQKVRLEASREGAVQSLEATVGRKN